MAARPDRLPRWSTDGGTVLEPSSGEKDAGWAVDDKPPARKMNWLQNRAYQWLDYFDTLAIFVPLGGFEDFTADLAAFGAITNDMHYSPGEKQFAIGDGGKVYFSFNEGVPYAWGSVALAGTDLQGITRSSVQWIAALDNGNIETTPDESTAFTTRSTGSEVWRTATANDGALAAVVAGDNGVVFQSADGGVTWNDRTITTTDDYRVSANNGAGIFVIAATAQQNLQESSDGGITWTARSAGAVAYRQVVWDSVNSQFVLLASDGKVYTSTDGQTWTEVQDFSSNITGMAYWIDRGAIVLMFDDGAKDQRFLVSTDGGATFDSTGFPLNSNFLGTPDLFIIGAGSLIGLTTATMHRSRVSLPSP